MKQAFFLWISLVNTVGLAAEPKAPAAKNVSYEKKTHLDFEEKSVDGEFLKPDGQAVRGDTDLSFDSMLSLRTNFSKELKRSAGAIR